METLPAIAVILIVTALTTLMIILGRKIEQPIIPGIATIGNLAFLIYHSMTLDNLPAFEKSLITTEYNYLVIGFVLLLVSFISFLWVDDIVAKKKNKKVMMIVYLGFGIKSKYRRGFLWTKRIY